MNTSDLVGPDFNQPTSNSPAYSFDCTNIIAGLMCAPPAIGPGTYALFVRSTNLVLDANLAGTANGTPLVQSGYHAGTNQKWTVTYVGGGQYSMIGVGSGRAVEVNGFAQTDNAAVDLWDYIGANNQKFTLVDKGGGCADRAVYAGRQRVQRPVAVPGAVTRRDDNKRRTLWSSVRRFRILECLTKLREVAVMV